MQTGTVQVESAEIDHSLRTYHSAVEAWIAAIREEEALAFKDRTVAEVDRWEQAHFKEEDARKKVKAAKRDYESALRDEFFHFR
ncbi:MAG: hypothetical protein WBY44_21125 [Bryobacteraceae bacterium]